MSPDTDNSPSTETRDVPVRTRRTFPWRRFVFGLVILVVGFALGMGSAIAFRHEIFRIMRGRGAPPPPPPIQERVAEKLDLTPEQRAQFGKIFDNHWARMMQGADPQAVLVETELQALEAEVAPILTEEQQAQWRESAKRMRFYVPIRLAIEAGRKLHPDGETPDKWRGHKERKEEKR